MLKIDLRWLAWTGTSRIPHLPRYQALHVVLGCQLPQLLPVRNRWKCPNHVKGQKLLLLDGIIFFKSHQGPFQRLLKNNTRFKKRCLLLFHQQLQLNQLLQGGLVNPADVNKDPFRDLFVFLKMNGNKFHTIDLWARWKWHQNQQANLQLFRRDPEDLWGQEDQVDPGNKAPFSHYCVKSICTKKIHTNTQTLPG